MKNSNSGNVVLSKRSEVENFRKIINLVWRFINKFIFPLTFRLNIVRCVFLRIFGAKVGRDVVVSSNCHIEFPGMLTVGNNSSIGQGVYILCLDRVTIGANVCISNNVAILTGSHDLSSPSFSLYTKPITLHDGAWLSYGATLLPGVTMGQGSVAGAKALVYRDVGPWEVVSGNPAKKIGIREIK